MSETILRLVPKETVHFDELRRALAEWPVLNVIQADDETPYELVWLAPDGMTQVHYIEDFKLGIDYLTVFGSDPIETAQELRSLVPIYSQEEIDELRRSAITRDDRVRALYLSALTASTSRKSDVQAYVVSALHSDDAQVRGAAVLAIAYLGWPEFAAPLEELATTEADETIRREANQLARFVRRPEGAPGQGESS